MPVALLSLLAVLLLFGSPAAAQVTGRVSVTSSGTGALGGDSGSPSISDDGRLIAFASSATNLATDDGNGASDVFVHDRRARLTRMVSRSSAGVPGNAASTAPVMSGDGTTVAFVSSATNFVTGAPVPSVYLHHLPSGTTTLLTLPADRIVDLTLGERALLSVDRTGRNVSVRVRATGAIAQVRDLEVLVIDRQANSVHRVFGMHGSLSADGRLLVYDSRFENSTTGGHVGLGFVVVRDLLTGLSKKVPAPGGTTPAACQFPAISGDGRFVAMECELPQAGITRHGIQIYLHDAQTSLTTLVSAVPSSFPSNRHSFAPDITEDGRYVVFNSMNQVTGDTEGGNQVFRFDRVTGARALLSTSLANEVRAGALSFSPTVSADGQTVAFASSGGHFVVEDSNGADDVFIVDPTCAYSVTTTPVTAPATGGAVPVMVSTSAECTWVARSPSVWIGLATAAGVPGGTGSAQLTVTVAPNTTGASRSAVIDIAGQSLTVTQPALDCSVTLTAVRRAVPASGSIRVMNVTTPSPLCTGTWSVTTDASWLTPSPTSGTGNQSVLFNIPPNPASLPRAATVSVGGSSLTMAQSATACVLSLNPSSVPTPAAGATGVIQVTSSLPGCPWDNRSTASWVSVSPAFGIGSGPVSYQVLPNTTGESRTATIEVAASAVFVSQTSGVVTGAPTGLTATVVGNNVTLQWVAPLGTSVTAYVLEAGSAPGVSDIASLPIGNVRTFSTGAPDGTYYVRVWAVTSAGASAPSNEVVIRVGCASAPLAPSALTSAVSGTQVLLSWTAVAGATGYTVDVGTSPSVTDIGSFPVADAVMSAQGPAGSYYVRVRARNACGVSGPSNEVLVTIGAAVIGAPSGLAVVVTGGTASFTWLAPTTGGAPAGYVLEAGSAPGLSDLATVPLGIQPSFATENVPPGTYYVRVRARNAHGSGPPSAEIVVVVP